MPSSLQTMFPSTMVSRHTPYSSIPAKGVARPMDWKSSGLTTKGLSRSKTVRSAGWPSARGVPKPKRRAGLV